MAHERTTFFIIDRKLMESEMWLQDPFTKGQAWVDLIGMANFRDLKRYEGDEVKIYKRGQVVTSERTLAARWHWSREKVRNYLKLLATDGMATTKKTAKGVVISLENYGFYQDVVKQKDHKTDQQPTTDRPLTDHKKTEKNNVNNDNNDNNVRERELRSFGPGGRLALTPSEMDQFLQDYPQEGQRYIEELDEYKGATGKKYQNDYAALRRWARNDQKFGKQAKGSGYKSGLEKITEEIENGTFSI